MKATANKLLMVGSGKRKTAVAKVKVTEGSGKVVYSRLPLDELREFHRLALQEPLQMAQEIVGEIKADFTMTSFGGGKEGQIQATRLALAKALVAFTKSIELKKAYLKYDRSLLVADTRRKEAYKPGDSKARAKRQKSYR